MKRGSSREKAKKFSEALQGKKIPLLTLDNKWYQLLDGEERKRLAGYEQQLNDLLKDLGKANTETRNIKMLKKKLMSEIVSMVDEVSQKPDSGLDEKIEKHKELVEECNERLAVYEDQIQKLPDEIDRINFQLMLETMEYCYNTMQTNEKEIRETTEWVAQMRMELKKRLVRKQELEERNHTMYSYMHDIFGMDVVDIFDMQYGSAEEKK